MPDVVGVPQFPAALNTLDSLVRVTNAVIQVTLNGAIDDNDLSIVVSDGSLLPASGTFTFMDNGEIVIYESKSSNTLTAATLGRGADGGPSATSHADGCPIEVHIVALHHSTLAAAIMALEAKVGKTVEVLTDAATVATDAALANRFRVTLGASRTLGNPSNPTDNQQIVWEIIQDGTGGRTLALDTKFALGADITAVTLSTGANKHDFLTVIYNQSMDKFLVVGFIRGFS